MEARTENTNEGGNQLLIQQAMEIGWERQGCKWQESLWKQVQVWAEIITKQGKLYHRYTVTMKFIHAIGDLKASTGPFGQGYGFSSGHVWMGESGCEES